MCNDRLILSNPPVHKYDPETSSFSITWEVVKVNIVRAHPDPPSRLREGASHLFAPSLGCRGACSGSSPTASSVGLALPSLGCPVWGRTSTAGSLQSVPSSAVQSHFLRMPLSALEQFQPQDTGTQGRHVRVLRRSRSAHRTAAAQSWSWRKGVGSVQEWGVFGN